MAAKEKVYEQLIKLIKARKSGTGITATELESCMDIKRSVISHYLNILLTEGKVLKTDERPVRYYLPGITLADKQNISDVFANIIGADGSLKKQVEQCKSAVIYPPYGLPVIINGSSGVGKSFMASLIYKYAIDKGVITKNAPFSELNCADYANNPELLSSMLFGYVEGAFTGAVKEKKGLMDEADGGYLFLDEIHRLSSENQEKLFLYLDKGKFRRLGENEAWHTVNVRLIFATTEDANKVLLETFYRRIPIRITLPDFQKRPLVERVDLIELFYQEEAKILNRNVKISTEVLEKLAFSASKGNIGMLKNYVKLSCADAYKNQMDNESILITPVNLPDDLVKSETGITIKQDDQFFYIEKDSFRSSKISNQLVNIFDEDIENFISSIKNYTDDNIIETLKLFIIKIKKIMKKILPVNLKDEHQDSLIKFTFNRLSKELNSLSCQYGIAFSTDIKNDLFTILMFVIFKANINLTKDKLTNEIQKIKRYNPKAYILSCKLIARLEECNHEKYDILYLLFPLIMSDVISADKKIQAIIAAHGNSTASSIASIANSVCGSYIFEPFDMPITDDSYSIIDKVNNYIDGIDTSNGLIVLVDMGSLEQMYEPIKNHLEGELLLINNITTSMALDIGLKIYNDESMEEIIEKSKNAYKTEVRYYEGITKGDNIIISCISGIGIAHKIKTIFDKSLGKSKIEVITCEYSKLKSIIQSSNTALLKRTKLIITTTGLDTHNIPSINIEDILCDRGEIILKNVLKNVISCDDYKELSDKLIKFFSIEGISNNLSFLNPNVVVNEVECIIKQYEDYYNVHFKNYLRMNLYMHISVMIERLMIGEGIKSDEDKALSNAQIEFVDVTRKVFNALTEKYRIDLPQDEILLIYEIIENNLKK